MKKHRYITAFYLETLLLILVFVIMILMLTRVFGVSRSMTADAELLSNSVCLAQNAAEAVSASDSLEAVSRLLDEGGNTSASDGTVDAFYNRDMTPRPVKEIGAPLRVQITWEPEPGDGNLVHSVITVYGRGRKVPVYQLATAVYLEGVSP